MSNNQETPNQQPTQSNQPTDQREKNPDFKQSDMVTDPDIIFSSLFTEQDRDTLLERKSEFMLNFTEDDMFRNEHYIFYTIVKNYPKITPNEAFIKTYLQTNRARFLKSPSIDIGSYRVSELDPYVEFVNSTIETFKDCLRMETTDSDFNLSLANHKMDYMSRHSIEVLSNAAMMLSEGVKIGYKQLAGFEDMHRYVLQEMQKLNNLNKKQDRRGIITYGVDNINDSPEDSKLKLVTKFGIESLDAALGGIYEGDMVSLLAPAKGGKSRFATYVLHQAIISGVSIVMWSVENGYKGWEALIRARHFEWFYNSKQTDPTQLRYIDADMIRKDELSPELKELEQASWTDLQHNPKYGKMSSIDADFNFETLLDSTEQAIDKYGAKLICLDYLQLVTGGDPRMSKNERIGELYKAVLQFCKKKKVGGIFPAQLKQTVVGDIQRVDPDELINMELRDSAGESYEVIKTPDVNLALYGTVEDIRSGHMKLLSIPSRNSAPFQPIDLNVKAGTCTFSEIKEQIA